MKYRPPRLNPGPARTSLPARVGVVAVFAPHCMMRNMSEPAPGMLLVATPELIDPNFAGSVVLLVEANDEGALGVILNRPSGLAVAQVLPAWSDVVDEPEVLFQGGPVETDGALAVALLRQIEPSAVGFRSISGTLGLLDLDTPAELIVPGLACLRIFAGYAGWSPDQLDGEVDQGHWYVVPALSDDIFRLDSGDLWRDVLRRQPGELAMHSTRPADPDLN